MIETYFPDFTAEYDIPPPTYEEGYEAGVQDALASQQAQINERIAKLVEGLDDLAFTYAEASTHILSALQNVVLDALQTILPTAANICLTDHIKKVVDQMLSVDPQAAIQILASSEDLNDLQALVAPSLKFPLNVVEVPNQPQGHIVVTNGEIIQSIAIQEHCDAILEAIAGFFAENQKDLEQNE